ncbi:Sigma-54-dependent Fis family transcriptional regulator [Lasiodiplodia theobromae]|uniref:Sigma-54-dependent Fis family transcriptional regulator n=1 Tax=Lasiodiplodia theobromae TaxID=45133 RepID=UPI0015C3FB99|nr:Sigma-54-dependent Fis family transcriptional regulator [Lasiodiplodia theobromae]KAF4539917.1 Sigma-54-dependent Fis family transcriptional regulator [Lasiodiplodia theobromae]
MPTTTPQPIAHWRCCLCHHTEHNAITRDLSRPAHTTTTGPPFHPARCALCAQPPCARCLIARPAPRWDASSHTYTSPSCLIEWNPARRDAWGFVCMHCGVPTLVSRARRFAHAAARTAWSRPSRGHDDGDDDGCMMVLGPGATVSEEVAAGMVARGGRGDDGRPYEGFEMEFLPFQRRRKVGVGEMLGLVARCGNEACGQPMCDESLEFYVPVDDGEDEEVSRWELADWICSAAEGTARWVDVAKLKRVAKGALGLGVIYYVLL